jgi:hypothetical protein
MREPGPEEDGPGGGPHRALIGLVAIVVLIVVVLFVVYRLHQVGRIQDCVAAGRTNCAPIETR